MNRQNVSSFSIKKIRNKATKNDSISRSYSIKKSLFNVSTISKKYIYLTWKIECFDFFQKISIKCTVPKIQQTKIAVYKNLALSSNQKNII